MSCIFCNLDRERIILDYGSVFSMYDKFPASPGHTLIVSRRHVETYFDTNPTEREYINKLIDNTKNLLDKEYKPTGYNIGMNCGKDAGQTVMHFHLHIVPRYHGDTVNPRGGVRNVIPGKGDYVKD